MESILAITIGVIVFVLVAIFVVWRWTYGAMFRTAIFKFFGLLFSGDSKVDPEAPIYPSQEAPISDLLRQQAEVAKGSVAPPVVNDMPLQQASIPATTSPNKPKYEPPYTENPVTITYDNQKVGQVDNAIVSPPQPLVEDNSFEQDDPIIDQQHIDPDTPSADTLDTHAPTLGKMAKSDKSDFGVRYADHSPGRVIRDKRSSRNSS